MPRTYMQKTAEVQRAWRLVDAKGRVLGHLATEIAVMLIGKDKPTYTPHIDSGDYVVVINASEIEVTGRKADNKMYYNHSGMPGGLRERTFNEVMAKKPGEVIEIAVHNMLPKNRLRADRMARLKVYAGAEHKHASQFEVKGGAAKAE